MAIHPQLAEVRVLAGRLWSGEAHVVVVHDPASLATVFLRSVVVQPELEEDEAEEMMQAFGDAIERAGRMTDEELEEYERRLDAEIDAAPPPPRTFQSQAHVGPGQREAAKRLKRLGYRAAPPEEGWTEYTHDVDDAEAAAALALRTMAEAFGLGPAAWLWITDEGDARRWPKPLPKPTQWPPE